ncbi:GNAT family N-acetyltransferase [Herbidospora mongoliensis]|uniref:GNAT family N-acetyltransferase n=1 Tax=Herbidospora mongoliensis TaxID=688067 RepID=UPI00082EDEB3|nr:GNAT family N-acetyltransferase [Herbidospora mongoliensis]
METYEILANPVWAALTGPHAHLAVPKGRTRRYLLDVSPFAAVPDVFGPDDWADLDGQVLTTCEGPAAEGWETIFAIPGVQMEGSAVAGVDSDVVTLGPADVPEMLDLVARTQPGPFAPRTIEMGAYLGLRAEGRLIAMAGERLKVPGWTEISAVCTDPAHRGRGLASQLVLAVVAGIRARGERPFLHAATANVNALRLYESLGFTITRNVTFRVLRPQEALTRDTAEVV